MQKTNQGPLTMYEVLGYILAVERGLTGDGTTPEMIGISLRGKDGYGPQALAICRQLATRGILSPSQPIHGDEFHTVYTLI